MDDRNIMENLLLTTKSACDLYLHGSIESSTPNVHHAFTGALNSTINLQEQIYKQMEQKGWYTSDTAPQQQMAQVKQKYVSQFGNS